MKIADLFENSNNTIGIIFGRFNPPHKGHRAAWEMAAQNPIWYVGTNQNTQGPKDPLPFDVKVKAMSAIWPEVSDHIVAETSWLTLASLVHQKHNQDGTATLLLYTDEEWVGKTIKKYNGVEGKHGRYDFQQIKTVPTPRLSSATALRQAVANNNPEEFADAAGVPADTPIDGVPFFELVEKYLSQYQ
jgi:nicotinamide mononucleotide adenylyltransferase